MAEQGEIFPGMFEIKYQRYQFLRKGKWRWAIRYIVYLDGSRVAEFETKNHAMRFIRGQHGND